MIRIWRFIVNIFTKWLGVRIGEFCLESPGRRYISLPFPPKEVYLDWDLSGIGCVDSECKIQVEKTCNGFVVDAEFTGERVDFSWLATK